MTRLVMMDPEKDWEPSFSNHSTVSSLPEPATASTSPSPSTSAA